MKTSVKTFSKKYSYKSCLCTCYWIGDFWQFWENGL